MLVKLTAGRSSVKDGREGVSGVEGGHRQARWAHQWQVQHAVLVNNFFNHPNFFGELFTLSYFQTAHILKRQLTNRGSGICNCIYCLIEGFQQVILKRFGTQSQLILVISLRTRDFQKS
jgi:hypothetical protein